MSVDAIDQFQVETSGTAVMFNGQGASNYVIKSGTNTFHGSGFEYFRNKALDAKAFFAATKPDDNQHEYGSTLGGPIRRNRMFFFVAYYYSVTFAVRLPSASASTSNSVAGS
jgi:hypothetical protein